MKFLNTFHIVQQARAYNLHTQQLFVPDSSDNSNSSLSVAAYNDTNMDFIEFRSSQNTLAFTRYDFALL